MGTVAAGVAAMVAAAAMGVAALMRATPASVAASASFGGFLDVPELALAGMVTLISQTFKECLAFRALRAGHNLTVFVVFKFLLF